VLPLSLTDREVTICEYRGVDFLKVLRGDTKGDYGFEPKRGISLRLRPKRVGAGESEPRAGVRQSEGNSCSKEEGGPRVVDLNKLLPTMLEKLGRWLSSDGACAGPLACQDRFHRTRGHVEDNHSQFHEESTHESSHF
jgi:hypothetical protein